LKIVIKRLALSEPVSSRRFRTRAIFYCGSLAYSLFDSGQWGAEAAQSHAVMAAIIGELVTGDCCPSVPRTFPRPALSASTMT
jgi:hypothetical protein